MAAAAAKGSCTMRSGAKCSATARTRLIIARFTESKTRSATAGSALPRIALRTAIGCKAKAR
ncbi:hypothetical protein NS14008_10350 [Nocardia seriolae]|nr:hypothetical protein NS14008_10350 [Nocardia seriolae]PSK32179.1 hypothetical protein C6575_06130 [Nocardia seriolae]RLP32614.1 hypothetical protein D6158_07250 [Nocardia seriolae]